MNVQLATATATRTIAMSGTDFVLFGLAMVVLGVMVIRFARITAGHYFSVVLGMSAVATGGGLLHVGFNSITSSYTLLRPLSALTFTIWVFTALTCWIATTWRINAFKPNKRGHTRSAFA